MYSLAVPRSGAELDLYRHHLAAFDDCTMDHLEDCTCVTDFKSLLGRLIAYCHARQCYSEPGLRVRPTEVLGLDIRTYTEKLSRLDRTGLVQNLLQASSTLPTYVEHLQGLLEDPIRAGKFHLDVEVYAQTAQRYISEL